MTLNQVPVGKGFTKLRIVVVLSIAALLASIGTYYTLRYLEDGQASQVR